MKVPVHKDTAKIGNVPGKARNRGSVVTGAKPKPMMPFEAAPVAGNLPGQSGGQAGGRKATPHPKSMVEHTPTPVAGNVPDGRSGMDRAMSDHADMVHPVRKAY